MRKNEINWFKPFQDAEFFKAQREKMQAGRIEKLHQFFQGDVTAIQFFEMEKLPKSEPSVYKNKPKDDLTIDLFEPFEKKKKEDDQKVKITFDPVEDFYKEIEEQLAKEEEIEVIEVKENGENKETEDEIEGEEVDEPEKPTKPKK